MMIRTLGVAAVLLSIAAAQQVDGLAHVALRVSDLDRSRAFYKRLGFEQAFEFRDAGKITVTFIKINDRQFLELYPRTEPSQRVGFFHACLETASIEALRGDFVTGGLQPSEISKGRAGNLLFSIRDPEDNVVEFLQFLPGSLHSGDRGAHLGAARISNELLSASFEAHDAGAERSYLSHALGVASRYLEPAGASALTFAVEGATPAERTDPDGVRIRFAASRANWRSVADHLITTAPESYPFNWGEGVQMMGLMKAARAAHDERYIDYVERWAALNEAKEIESLLNIGPVAAPSTRRGYCGHWSPATAILYLDHARHKPEHSRLVHAVAEFIRAGAERSSEGALGHWQGSHQLWVDTLFMACPLLAGVGAVDDAANQIIVYARHLEDEKTGLFYHMWDWQTGTHSEGYWGRGNGWVLMSLADTLEAMKKSDPKYGELTAIAHKLTRGIASTQNSGGLWYTILDEPDSYEEVSASSMFVYGLLKLARLGVVPMAAREPAMKAWHAINARYVKDGQVLGVSAGTDPKGRDAYRTIALGAQNWGTGAYLLAASEVK